MGCRHVLGEIVVSDARLDATPKIRASLAGFWRSRRADSFFLRTFSGIWCLFRLDSNTALRASLAEAHRKAGPAEDSLAACYFFGFDAKHVFLALICSEACIYISTAKRAVVALCVLQDVATARAEACPSSGAAISAYQLSSILKRKGLRFLRLQHCLQN